MAKSKRSVRSQPLALELLMTDHRKVEDLFSQYEDEKEGDEDSRRQLAQKICAELKVHTQVEEELFYPFLRETLEDDDMDLVEEAQVEHNGAKDLIEQIEAAAEIDDEYNAKVKVLGEYIKHHVNEEENEIFPKLSDEQDALDELGQEMSSRKQELAEEMGLEQEASADEEEGEEEGESAPSRSHRSDEGTRRSH
ncbi:MAG TPA: hemerythrin domain-containing protein [Usitatibacter sp.]|jgi:hemerythrin-like domain-containing protein|nr:hemerythrin domain-containing protein [Usitatibacter sp.]